GLLTVVANRRQHQRIRELLERVQESAQRQVLVEATVVEVTLSYNYQTGVGWSRIADGTGFTLNHNMTASEFPQGSPVSLISYRNDTLDLIASIRLLEQFGDVKILSSPKAMVLNNQTALLKVVDNKVYFTMEVQSNLAQNIQTTTFESTLHTVPVGFVMTVTPQISDTDTVIMNVRPTVSRIIGYVNDPNPALADANVQSKIPEIQVREIESILKVNSGQIAVLGGLMQDSYDQDKRGLPGITRTPVGDAFGYRDDQFGKTELVIFLRPTVIHNASLDADLHQFSSYLDGANETRRRIP
ncbi:MAG TPA: type II and III secretion system protein, partial [Chromatiaceae bacterium]|nr:type II and III secretion system protein [Chromatiaceae bacterium]